MENNTVSCKLKIPKNLSAKTPPILVSFSSGNVNLNCSNKLKFKSCRHVQDQNVISSKARRVLLANSDRLNYRSVAFEENNIGCSKLRYFIGVRNKTSKRMKVYDAIMFHLNPSNKSDFHSSTTQKANYRERLDELTSSFGSKEMKRSMNARQKYTASSQPLDNALEDMSLDESLNSSSHSFSVPSSSKNIEYIPPQNRTAKCIYDVYEISDVISAEEDKYLSVRADLLLQDLPTHLSQWKIENTYCEYVLRHLEQAVDNVKVNYLLYYNYLVMFSRLMAADMKKRDPAPQIPEPIKTNLLERYTVTSVMESGKTVRSFPQIMKDKLLAYILVLALFIDDYCVNLSSVQVDMKYGTLKVSNIAQVLGCHVVRRKIGNSAVQFAELKLPLFVLEKRYKKK